MGLLSGSSAGRHGFALVIQLLSGWYRLLGFTSYLAGIITLCFLAHNEYNGKVYFSEHALQPGVAQPTFGPSDYSYYQRQLGQLKKYSVSLEGDSSLPVEILKEVMSQAGLEAFNQSFSVSDPFGDTSSDVTVGQNVFGIARAPRIASTESMVIAAPWTRDNLHGVSLALALGAMMKKQAYWAKDVIILIVDKDTWGVEAWLQAYHGEVRSDFLRSEALPASAGSIQAALCLNVASDRFSGVDLQLEGINGLMPNLDLVNLVATMAQYNLGTQVTFHEQGGYAAYGEDLDAAQARLHAMLAGAAQQVSLQPSGVHSSFMRYRIESLTIRTTGKSGRFDIGGLAGLVEGAFRSINNLLERFHQSFFFYFAAGGDRYVSIGMYMPSVGLLLLPLILRGLVLWFSCSGTNKSTADKEQSMPAAFAPLPVYLGQAVSLLVLVGVASVGVFLSPWLVRDVANPAMCSSIQPIATALIFFAMPFITARLARGSGSSSSGADRVQQGDFPGQVFCITVILWLAVLGVLALINMPFSVALALPTVPVLLLTPVSPPRNVAVLALQTLAVLVVISPPSLLTGAVALRDFLHAGYLPTSVSSVFSRGWLVWQNSLAQYELLGIWLYPIFSLCVYPLLILCWAVLCSRYFLIKSSKEPRQHTD